METELTPEAVMEMGRQFWRRYLQSLTVEERLAGISTREIIDTLTIEEILEVLDTREVVAILMEDEYSAELIKRAVLESMDVEEIEAYLHKIKRPKTTPSDAKQHSGRFYGYAIR